MPPPGPTPEQDKWVRDFLGVQPGRGARASGKAASRGPQPGLSPSGLAVGVGLPERPAFDAGACRRSVGPALTKDGPYKPGARISASLPVGPSTQCRGADGRQVSISRDSKGRVAMTHPAAPIEEITFSGGGGKGAALPGAVWALAQTGILAQAREIHGASVGSMTAAMLAAGMTPQEFQDISDKTDFGAAVKGDALIPLYNDADGLEAVVRDALKSTLNKRIAEFAQGVMQRGETIDPQDEAVLTEMSAKFAKGAGPTFGDLGRLSKIVPTIKEVVVTGTMIGVADDSMPPDFLGDPVDEIEPQLMVFSAATEPDVDVALAVHASAALPPVFNPVDIKLKDGKVYRFEDGGVLNNAPSSDTLGRRAVDPVPTKGKMTFVFQEDIAENVLKGKTSPDRGWLDKAQDFVMNSFAGAENAAADYAKNKTLSEQPDDVVMVPLKFTTSSGKQRDKSGFVGGTLDFNMNKEDRIRLQEMTQEETLKHVQKRTQPETVTFASDAQMLNCVPRQDLQAMAASDYPGAAETLAYRDGVTKAVQGLEKATALGIPAQDPRVQGMLKWINDQAKGDQERLACAGRELNRSGKLDKMLAASKDKDGKPSTGIAAVDAGLAVNEVVQVRAVAKDILDKILYPLIVRQGTKGVEGNLLTMMENALRDATTRKDINRALMTGIDYFSAKFDALGLLGNGDVADDLRSYLQPLH